MSCIIFQLRSTYPPPAPSEIGTSDKLHVGKALMYIQAKQEIYLYESHMNRSEYKAYKYKIYHLEAQASDGDRRDISWNSSVTAIKIIAKYKLH